jgi:hypothetical protein
MSCPNDTTNEPIPGFPAICYGDFMKLSSDQMPPSSPLDFEFPRFLLPEFHAPDRQQVAGEIVLVNAARCDDWRGISVESFGNEYAPGGTKRMQILEVFEEMGLVRFFVVNNKKYFHVTDKFVEKLELHRRQPAEPNPATTTTS